MHTEPQVLDLLMLLVENHHRVVDRDELVEQIWRGRIISDWAISSRIKRLCQNLGDDGQAQRFIQTLRGRGFRIVEDVRLRSARVVGEMVEPGEKIVSAQPSIAVLPFNLIGGDETWLPLTKAIQRELISLLATLRWIKVIAPGSSFRFRGSAVDVAHIGEALSARYCLTGTIEIFDRLVTIDTELCDARDTHAGMAFFAAMSNWRNGDMDKAQKWVSEARRRNPYLSYENLRVLVPSSHQPISQLVSEAARDLGV